METILDQITGSFDAGFYFAAINMSLALPDICNTLQLSPGARVKKTVKARYIDWFNQYLVTDYPKLRGIDLFALRNGVLHSGAMKHPELQYDRIVFATPNRGNNVFSGQIDRILLLDAKQFCNSMVAAVRRWQKDHDSDPNVIRNLPFLVQERPNGLPPYVVGAPVIA